MFKLGRTQETAAPAADAQEEKSGPAPLSSREQAEREAQNMLDQLRGQPGFGVVVTASDAARASVTLGERLTAEMEELTRRERTLREVRELAMRRVSEMTVDQIQRLIEFCV